MNHIPINNSSYKSILAEYKLLVKVAEIVASKLVAKVVIDEAIQIALKRMNVEIQSSEEEEFETIHEQHPCPPRYYLYKNIFSLLLIIEIF